MRGKIEVEVEVSAIYNEKVGLVFTKVRLLSLEVPQQMHLLAHLVLPDVLRDTLVDQCVPDGYYRHYLDLLTELHFLLIFFTLPESTGHFASDFAVVPGDGVMPLKG
jgi:hypothetical protein